MNKFKVGDRVRVVLGGWQFCDVESSGAMNFMGSAANEKEGAITRVLFSNTHSNWWYKVGGSGNYFSEEGIASVGEKEIEKPSPKKLVNAIVRCHTKEQVEKLHVEYRGSNHSNRWEDDNFTVRIKGGKMRSYVVCEGWDFYKSHSTYRNYTFIDANDYFGESQPDEPPQPKEELIETEEVIKETMLQKLTKTLKKHLPGDIQKQYRAGFRNGDIELTADGRTALMDVLADKFQKELTESAVDVIKEEEKKDK